MIPLVNDTFKFIFYFNPKSACSTYRKLFLDLHRSELPQELQSTVTIHNISANYKPLAKGNYSDYFRYTVVRNPFPRVVSAFVDKCFQYKYPAKIRYQNKILIKTIFTPIFKFLSRPVNFDEGFSFEEFLDYLLYSLERKHPVDLHFRPQSAPGIDVDRYYRLEDDITKIHEIFDHIYAPHPGFADKAKIMLANPNHGKKMANPSFPPSAGQKKFDGFLADANFKDLESLKQQSYIFDYSSFFDESIEAKVQQIFATDISNYRYHFPY